MAETPGKAATWRKAETDHKTSFIICLCNYFLSFYLISESAPASTMWSGPPSQLIAVDANLDKDSLSRGFISNVSSGMSVHLCLVQACLTCIV